MFLAIVGYQRSCLRLLSRRDWWLSRCYRLAHSLEGGGLGVGIKKYSG